MNTIEKIEAFKKEQKSWHYGLLNFFSHSPKLKKPASLVNNCFVHLLRLQQIIVLLAGQGQMRNFSAKSPS